MKPESVEFLGPGVVVTVLEDGRVWCYNTCSLWDEQAVAEGMIPHGNAV